MTKFHAGRSGNPAGRPRGTSRIDGARLRRAFNSSVEPHVVELLQRGVERALAGDAEALNGLLGIIAGAMALADGPKPTLPQTTGDV